MFLEQRANFKKSIPEIVDHLSSRRIIKESLHIGVVDWVLQALIRKGRGARCVIDHTNRIISIGQSDISRGQATGYVTESYLLNDKSQVIRIEDRGGAHISRRRLPEWARSIGAQEFSRPTQK